jgi:hypothetical protein
MSGSWAEMLQTAMRTFHAGEGPLRRAGAVARALVVARWTLEKSAAGHCEVTQSLARRLGLDGGIVQALGRLFERWDGRGLPGAARGEDVPRRCA